MNMSFTILLSVVCLALLPTSISGCNSSDTLNATDAWQKISSSNYPNNYQNNENHCWNIISSVDNLMFEVISYDLETNHDYLRIYDISEDLFIAEMAYFTGNGVGREQQTLTTGIRVEFTSDDSGTGAGFQLRFKSYTSAADDDQDNLQGDFLEKNGAGAETGVSTEVRSTSTYLTATSVYSYFVSPGYYTSSGYSNNELCYWYINSDGLSGITLARIFINTEYGFDWVYVYDGWSTLSTRLNGWSGYSNSLYYLTSSGNYLLVVFDSDATNSNYSGFRFGYKLSSSNAVISSSSSSIYKTSLLSATAIAGIVFGVLFSHIQH